VPQEIEIEYKNLLTREEFTYLLESFPFPERSQRQVNYYFETKDLSLSKKKCALRIREKNAAYKLTLKQPHREGILETTDRLTKEEAFSWIEGEVIPKQHTTFQLKQLSISPSDLTYFGSLITERREVKYRDVLLILDYSTYNNNVDYELEIEAPNHEIGLIILDKLINKYNIQRKHTPNKIQRFFSTLNN